MLVDGRSANRPGRTYGVFELGLEVTGGRTNVLPYTIWMPEIDTAHAVSIPSPTTAETVITTPRIPGLEVRIPAGSVIYDHEYRRGRASRPPANTLGRSPLPPPSQPNGAARLLLHPGG